LVSWCVALAVFSGSGWGQVTPSQPAPAGAGSPEEVVVVAAVKAGKPGEAEAAARSLVAQDSKLPAAWAVVASASLQRGVIVEAVRQAARAGELNDRDPFVQKIAGAVVGTYDALKPSVPDRTIAQINTLRHNMKGEAPFDEAYAEAKNAAAASVCAAVAPTVGPAPEGQAVPPPVVNVWVNPAPVSSDTSDPTWAPVYSVIPEVEQPQRPLIWGSNGGVVQFEPRRWRDRRPGQFGFVTGFDFNAAGAPISGGRPTHAQQVFRSLPAPGTFAAPGIRHVQPFPPTISVGPGLPPPAPNPRPATVVPGRGRDQNHEPRQRP
jgi:hypothetical protein